MALVGLRFDHQFWTLVYRCQCADKPKFGARYLLNHNPNDPELLSEVGEHQV